MAAVTIDIHLRNSLVIDEHTQWVVHIFQNLPGFQALSTSKSKNYTGPKSPGLNSQWSANTIRHTGIYASSKGFPGGSVVKPACKAGARGDVGLIPGLGRSPKEGMAPHSNILAWRIPWTEEPGGLQSTGSQRVGQDGSDGACTHTSAPNRPQSALTLPSWHALCYTSWI